MKEIYTTLEINLANRPAGFRKALEKLWDKHHARGIVAEFGLPDMQAYKTTARRVWRASQANPTNACAVLSNYRTVGDTALLDVELWGPRRDSLASAESNGVKHDLALRMVVNASGAVKTIGGIDLAPLDEFGDQQKLIVEQLA